MGLTLPVILRHQPKDLLVLRDPSLVAQDDKGGTCGRATCLFVINFAEAQVNVLQGAPFAF
jgi:hypothetical protein